MTDAKICPIMSRPSRVFNRDTQYPGWETHFLEVWCKKEKCAAWKEKKPDPRIENDSSGYCQLIYPTIAVG